MIKRVLGNLGNGIGRLARLSLPLIIVLPVLLVLTVGMVYAVKTKPEMLGLAKGQGALEAEAQKLLDEVGKLIALPTDEKPTIATVSDVEKIKEQSFFKNAQNGDQVIIYTKARKAILYRPKEKKIVEVGAVNLQDNQATGQVAGTKTAKFVLYNGSGTVGLTKTLETELTQKINGIEIVDRTNAQNEYDDSIVVDLSGQRAQDAEQVAKVMGIKVGTLPDGETKPDGVDFLVIVGKDKSQQ